MAELTVQSERAFLKQPHIFQNPKTAAKSKSKRWYKDVGLGFKTPKEAIEGTYIGTYLPPADIQTDPLTKNRQKMSFHRSNLHPWSYSFRSGCLCQNAPHCYYSVTPICLGFWKIGLTWVSFVVVIISIS